MFEVIHVGVMKNINSPISIDSSLGAKLRFIREKSGLTRDRLSKLSSIPIITIRSWESNKRIPKLSNLNKLIEVLKDRILLVLMLTI